MHTKTVMKFNDTLHLLDINLNYATTLNILSYIVIILFPSEESNMCFEKIYLFL